MGRKYRFKTRPYAHQKEGVRELLRNGFGGALLMEPRTGKTKTTIDYMSILHMKHGLKKVLVVCPARVMGTWVEELHAHCPYTVQTIVWDAQTRKTTPLPKTAGVYDLQVVIVNYEAFATPGKKLPSGRRSKASGRFKTRKQILDWIADDEALAVLDESHKIKSPSGKSASMIVSMAGKFDWRVILTGTPVTKAKRISDLYMQWKFLNPVRLKELRIDTHEDMRDFTGRWIHDNGFPQFVGAKHENLDIVRNAIFQDSYAVKRADCFDLPPRDDVYEYVTLNGETARVYDKMAEEMVAMLKSGEITEASIALVQALRLAQITGGTTNTVQGKTIRMGREKLAALKPHLEDALEREEKLVVAARFKPDLNAILAMANKMGLPTWQIRGGIKREVTDEAIREFRKHNDAGLMLVQPQAASLGIDLSTAAKMVWYSLVPSFVDFSQCCDRIALSRTSTTFVYLLARGTVDQVLIDTLKSDKDIAQYITTNPESLLRT